MKGWPTLLKKEKHRECVCVCVEGNGGEMGEGGQQTQTSCYKIYKPWGYDTQHDHYGQ